MAVAKSLDRSITAIALAALESAGVSKPFSILRKGGVYTLVIKDWPSSPAIEKKLTASILDAAKSIIGTSVLKVAYTNARA